MNCILAHINKLLRSSVEHTRLGRILRAPYREKIIFSFECWLCCDNYTRI